jgi:transcriptional regulator with XRE-family HTH domain
MATKAQQSRRYRPLPPLLKELREEAGLTQRDLGKKLGKPQSWIHNCESANRRVDLAEFCDWVVACGVEPAAAVKRFHIAR